MQFQVNAAGKRIYPSEFKKKVLQELGNGSTVAELARRYSIPMQNVLNWKKSQDLAVLGKGQDPKPEQSIPLGEYKKLLEENQRLKKSLVNMTVDRDILKDAVDIASKKKWI